MPPASRRAARLRVAGFALNGGPETPRTRHPAQHPPLASPDALAGSVLRKFEIFEIPPWEYRAAGLIPGNDLRTLDALHVAAIRVEADALVTYDARMRDAAAAIGLAVVQPGR